MVQYGMTSLEAIQAATINAADLLGCSDDIGTIEKGKYGDLIAVAGNRTLDVSLLEDVKFVVKGGQVVKR
jgi:imidazolonepropionase-like amidohydrolase